MAYTRSTGQDAGQINLLKDQKVSSTRGDEYIQGEEETEREREGYLEKRESHARLVKVGARFCEPNRRHKRDS